MPAFRSILFLLFLIPTLKGGTLMAQEYGGPRVKRLQVLNDCIKYDSLSSVPGSVSVWFEGDTITESQGLAILPFSSTLLLDSLLFSRLAGREIEIRYRAFVMDLQPEFRLRRLEDVGRRYPAEPIMRENAARPVSGISRQGSLSRGISAGNSQNSALSSDFNLQLSGRLSERYEINAALSDMNIPLQPEGTTTQLREFDRIFIELTGPQEKISAGDMTFSSLPLHFMRYTRKTQGLAASYRFSTGSELLPEALVFGGVSLSKGRYHRQVIQIREGDQGPYKLNGANGEAFIMILSGSERVYLDAELLERGSDRDYIIDYNTAQITFMQKRVITAQSRVQVEFEYSERSYARAVSQAGIEMKGDRATLRIQLFSENDLKSQNFQQVLGEKELALLEQVGDSLSLAVIPRIDSVSFNSEEVLYRQSDTMVAGIWYYDILVYNTYSDSASYRASFSYVGEGKGDYVRIASPVNGRVYQWVAPVGGKSAGDYQPLSILVAPGSTQGMSSGIDLRFGKASRLQSEFSLSRKDLNSFSEKDSHDDLGAAAMTRLSSSYRIRGDSSRTISPYVFAEWAGENYRPVERYLPAEFGRDWNLRNESGAMRLQAGAGAVYNSAGLTFGYGSEILALGSNYRGLRQNLDLKAGNKKLLFDYRGSLLNSIDSIASGSFYRHRAEARIGLGRSVLRAYNAVERIEAETSGLPESRNMAYHESSLGFFLPDSARMSGNSVLKYRKNYLPAGSRLQPWSESVDAGLTLLSRGRRKQNFDLSLVWRMLEYTDSNQSDPEQYLLARVNGSGSMAGGAMRWRLGYESNSGSELKKDLSYLRVADGQGLYSWNDYNGDSIKQLDEFEPAVFRDQANYIRIFIPGTEYESIINTRFLIDLDVRAPQEWRSRQGWRKSLSHMSGDFSLKYDTRTSSSAGFMAYLPQTGGTEDAGVQAFNSSWQGRIYFRRGDPKFGIDILAMENSRRTLFSNGAEDNGNKRYQLKSRVQLSPAITMQLDAQIQEKSIGSAYYTARNYRVVGPELEPSLSWQPGRIWRLRAVVRWQQKEDLLSPASSESFELLIEGRYSLPGKGFAQGNLSRRSIRFNGDSGSPVAWEMLSSLQPGTNYIWGFSVHYAVRSDLQLALQYDGRKPASSSSVHTGLVQARYLF